MKFIHTSDWHLGRQFHQISLLDDQRSVLNDLIDYIQLQPVDAVVVAGDIYDRAIAPTAAIELLDDVVERICGQLGVPLIMIPGNHDSAQRLGFAAKRMKNAGLYIISQFDDMLTPIVLDSAKAGEVAFYGMPYHDPEQVRNAYGCAVTTHDEAHQWLCEHILATVNPNQKQVLISHCFVDGASESDSERPLSIGGSERVNHAHFLPFDYVALGHLHQAQYKGAPFIRYSGSLMQYSFSEQHHKKGVTLVTLDRQGFVSAEPILLTAPHQMRVLEGKLEELLEQANTDPRPDDYLLVRLWDQQAILDPMEKLRAVYPNVLHIEKPGMLGHHQELTHSARLARSEIDMFSDFFLQSHSAPLTEQQQQALQDVLRSIQPHSLAK